MRYSNLTIGCPRGGPRCLSGKASLRRGQRCFDRQSNDRLWHQAGVHQSINLTAGIEGAADEDFKSLKVGTEGSP
jgi:hypothetical protein